MSLDIEINGINLANPTMLAAGVMGTTASSLKRIGRRGAGAVVTKSITEDAKKGHPGPVITKTKCGWINSMGLPNPGAKNMKDELISIAEGKIPVIGSVAGSNIDEYIKICDQIEKYVDAIELNLSCPNVEGGIISKNPHLVKKYTSSIKEKVDVPVWVKVSPETGDISKIATMAEKGGANSIVAINTYKGMRIDVESGTPILSNKIGGVSGKHIFPMALRCIYKISSEVNIPVIGVGGISNWRDAVEMIMAGAHAVQIGSAIGDNIDVFREISEGISKFMDRKNFSSVSEFRGTVL